MTAEGRTRLSFASVVGEERARDGLKRRAHDSSRAMDGEARFSLARTIRVYTPGAARGPAIIVHASLRLTHIELAKPECQWLPST